MKIAAVLLVAAACPMGCMERQEPKPREHQTREPAPGRRVPPKNSGYEVPRADFNRLAVQLNLPIYWIADKNGDGGIQPDETAALLFYGTAPVYVKNGAFTDEWKKANEQIVAAYHAPALADERRTLLRQDLAQGRPTLVQSNIDGKDKPFVDKMLHIADLIDRLYAIQDGKAALAPKLPSETESQSAFRRNDGVKCAAPLTENNPKCTAIPGAPVQKVAVYPDAIGGVSQGDPKFCAALEKAVKPDVLSPFVVVDKDGKAVPYTTYFKAPMQELARELQGAAALLDKNEQPLIAYLKAAAQSFTDNNWDPADEAWAKMNVDNSKWYVRVGPDETYWEPCAHKAGFHLTFAKINLGSKAWQAKLSPVQQDMEALIATHAGAPYAARKVTFHLPDFIDIIVNAGNDRTPLGATIGESLPNWGPVANEGRGRTVAMVNLYLDPDSQEARKQQAMSLLDAESIKLYSGSPDASLVNTILHEATHNLGPAHEYKVGGKKDGEVFGGSIASALEELKAQTGALYLVDFVKTKLKALDDAQARAVYADGVVWAFGHISQGMYTGTHARKAYGNLAAIQIGFLLDHGALTWNPNATTANGKDKGAFHLDAAKFPAAVDEMMKVTAGIKARGDAKLAADLFAKYVDSDKIVPHGAIAERFLRIPKASFVYAVTGL